MAVNIKLYNENNEEITEIDGLDYGMSRVRYPYIKTVYLKNLGNNDAEKLTVSADTLNKKEEVSEEEFSNQLKAKSWKSFSLDNKNFVEFLDLGKATRGNYYEGIKDIKFDLSSNKGTLKEVWSNATTNFIDNKFIFRKITYDSDDKTQGTGSARYNIDIGVIRDLDLTFYMKYLGDVKTTYSAIATLLLPIRVGSDGFGYGLCIQRNRANNKMFFAVYKRTKGMLDSNTSILGTRIMDIKSYIDINEDKPIRIRVYNNNDGYPTFEFYCNDEQQMLYSSADRSKFSLAFSDTDSGYYSTRGSAYLDMALYKGDIEFVIDKITVITEVQKQPIYIRTFIEEDSINQQSYKSALKIEWKE